MGRNKKEGGSVVRSFTLSTNEAWLLDRAAESQGMNRSTFVGWLISNFMISTDPLKELEEVKRKKSIINKDIIELEKKEIEILERIKLHKETIKNIDKLKDKAIQTIARKFQEGADYLEIENVSNFWAFRLNCDRKELMYKAGLVIKQ